MQLLLIGAKSQVGRSLAQLIESEDMGFTTLDTDADGYLSIQTVRDELKRSPADYLINTSLYIHYPQSEQHLDAVERVNYQMLADLAELSQSESIPLIQLSDTTVFDGLKDGLYGEEDELSPLGVYGKALLRGEQAIQASCPAHVILRAGAVFSQWGENYLTRVLEDAKGKGALIVPDSIKGCPTPAADVARVIIAMLKQMDCDSQTWGTFHYCSSDATSSFDFVEAVLSALSHHVGSMEREIKSIPMNEEASLTVHPVNSVMLCRKILDTFGIKQHPWRSGLTAIINDVYSDLPQVSSSAD